MDLFLKDSLIHQEKAKHMKNPKNVSGRKSLYCKVNVVVLLVINGEADMKVTVGG